MNNTNVKFTDRIIAVISYITAGFGGLLWIIYCNMLKKSISAFLLFNIYQAIVVTLFLYFANILLGLLHDLLIMIPYVRILVNTIRLTLTSPIYYNWSIIGLAIFVLYLYMILMTLAGKIAKIPFISDIIMYQLDRFK